MEKDDLHSSELRIKRMEDVNTLAILRRRLAIQHFLENPVQALEQHPDLSGDLLSFFSQSSNPNLDDTTGLPQHGRETDFKAWDAAQEWARAHLKSRGLSDTISE